MKRKTYQKQTKWMRITRPLQQKTKFWQKNPQITTKQMVFKLALIIMAKIKKLKIITQNINKKNNFYS